MPIRKVLIIAYYFPPLGGSGVYRTTKFVKYLPQFGWRPIVVCGDEARLFGIGHDETLLAEIPAEARVVRMPFVSPYGVRGRLRRLLRLRPTHENQDVHAPTGHDRISGEGTIGDLAREMLRRLGRVLHPLEAPPIDAALYWAFSIVPWCRRVIEEEKVDVIYTSSHPYADHVAGLILKRLTGRPWVADFRDPWTQAWDYRNEGWRRSIDRWAEQRVLREADRVVAVTPGETQGLLALSRGRSPNHFTTIENGFDHEDFAQGQARPEGLDGVTVLSHVGLAYDGTAIPALEALARLGPAGKSLRARFVGGLAPQELAWLHDHTLDVEIEVTRRVPHAEAICEMRACDALLLLRGDGPRWAQSSPGKLFEYMAAGRPIVLAGPEGEASRLLAASGTGVRLPLERPDEATAMLALLAGDPLRFRARYYHPDQEVIARYERRALTERLAGLFDELVEQETAQ